MNINFTYGNVSKMPTCKHGRVQGFCQCWEENSAVASQVPQSPVSGGSAKAITKGSRWVGIGQYYSGEITVRRAPQTFATLQSRYAEDDRWVKFDLPGHGAEECTVDEFLRYFVPACLAETG